LPPRPPVPTGDLLPLLDYVPALTPRWERPEHLTAIAELLERAETETVKALVSTPPQHGKTELLKHGLVRYMQQRPGTRNGFVSYAAQKSEHESRQMQWLADTAGLQPDGSRKHWQTASGSSLVAPGIGGPLTGHPIDGLLVVDDPHKDRREAESATMRQHVIDWFGSVAIPRLHPGASVIVVQTRWHPGDLYGHLADQGWEAVNLPALDDEGAALWPSQRPADFLANVRREIGEYEWASLYQGQPRPRGGTVFGGEPHYYSKTPTRGYTSATGADLAYTAKTHADWSVSVTMLRVGDYFYVVDVVRKQVDAPAFALTLKAQLTKWPGRMLWHASGTEKGAGQFVRKLLGPRFEIAPAKGDKFVRAQPVAAAWNDGKILLPESAPWLDTFLSEVCAFTGVNDLHDDQVDALASAFTALERKRSGYRELRGVGGKRRM
jgi:predicted phage terminase large subunit-like protein